jgi:hypothetical protein
VANGGIALLQFVVAIIVAGAIVAHDAAGKRVAQAIAARLATSAATSYWIWRAPRYAVSPAAYSVSP